MFLKATAAYGHKRKKVLISPRNESTCQRESPLGFPKQLGQLQQQLALCSLKSHSPCAVSHTLLSEKLRR